MTETKKYTKEEIRNKYGYDNGIIDFLKDEGMLVELPTTDTGKDWIDEAYGEGAFVGLDGERCFTQTTFRKAIEKHMPKPVEQELIPLDIHEIIKEIKFTRALGGSIERFDNIRDILSKYGVHKQEELIYMDRPLDPKEIYKKPEPTRYKQEERIRCERYDGFDYTCRCKLYGLSPIDCICPVTSTIEELDKTIDLWSSTFAKRTEIINNDMYICYRALDEGVIKDRLNQLLSSYNPTSKKYTREEIEKRYDNLLYKLRPTYKKKEVDTLAIGTVGLFLKDHNLLQE